MFQDDAKAEGGALLKETRKDIVITILLALDDEKLGLIFFVTDSTEPEGGGGSQKVRSMCVSGYLLLLYYH